MADFKKIEKKWQTAWEKSKIFKVKEGKKEKYYILEMLPYPSGSGLHMGHARNYCIGDVLARYKRMQGFNVLYPMGYDSFGLPAENAAIKEKSHPKIFTENAIKNFIRQQKNLGLSYDWDRILATHLPEYYKWNQWLFLEFLKRGLVYKKKAAVNYCKKCDTVLANEQVVNGRCWRHEDQEVEIKELEQWFFKITDYAEQLLKDLDRLYWPEDIKIMQRNWIGKSEGTEIEFEIINLDIKDAEFVFFHGFNSNSRSDFWPWLKKEIEDHGGKVVFTPDLPNTFEPNIEKQLEFVLKNHKFNSNTIIITHSLGGVLAMKLLPKLNVKINKLIMITPPLKPEYLDNKRRPILEECCDFKFDFSAIKRKVNKIIILADKNDHILPINQPREIAKNLSADIYIGNGVKSHFNNLIEPDVLNILFQKAKVFTTRPDTLFGVTFMVFAPEHPKVLELVKETQYEKQVKDFIKKVLIQDRFTRTSAEKEKEGMFIGKYAINPINNEKIPIYIANFVVMDYGTGFVMSVPAHDQRDFEFAKKYNLPIKQVILSENKKEVKDQAYLDNGILINSGKFNGLDNIKAIKEITKFLDQKNLGKFVIQYKLKDWLISRQRYWGTPIPVIYCDKCGIIQVPEKKLPILLPEKVKFDVKGNPLENVKEFVNVKCYKCKSNARRETDTMDTFVDSSWYFLRYCDNKNNKNIFNSKKVNYWMPIDQYIGGKEHATGHLIYFRFLTKVLKDMNLVNFDEPALRLFNQGMLHKNGYVMSKSRGNVVSPEEISEKYGIDTGRLFLLFVASPDKDMEWNDEGIEGAYRFINKIYNLFDKKTVKHNERLESKRNKIVKEVTENIESFRYNISIVKLMEYVNYLNTKGASKECLEVLLKLLAPFTPHLAEEFWHKNHRSFISLEKWPSFDVKKIKNEFEFEDKLIEQTIQDIRSILNIVKIKPKKGYIYCIPKEKKIFEDNKNLFEIELNLKINIFAVNDKNIYDPQNKAKKAKLGKAGIYIE